MIDPSTLTIAKAHDHLMKGDITSVQLTEAYLAEIKKKNPAINAFLEVFEDAIEQAKSADKRIAQAKENKGGLAAGSALSPLIGIPFAIKDNILISGRRAGSASKILEGYIAPYDATVIAKLKQCGVVFLGRTNMDEFAMGGSNENSAYGPVRNPHDETRVSGGSSGGSAASVAVPADGTGMALAALGSDTGGSVRQPASLCGVVGLKPTYGSISRYGVMAMGSSLDQIGPLGKTVEDVEIIYTAIKGNDPMDSTTLPDDLPNGFAEKKAMSAKSGKTKMTIGVPRHLLKEGVDPEVLKNYDEAIERFRKLGYDIKDISLPNSGYALAVYYVLMPAEASSNLARFDGVKYGAHKEGTNLLGDYLETRTAGFGREVRRRIMLGNYILSAGYYDAYYNKANLVRSLIRADYEKAFADVDLILTPTSPIPAFKIGEKLDDPLQMYLADIFTVTANLTRMPAISIPSGTLTREGKKLPLGIQLTAPDFGENALFTAGKDFWEKRGKIEELMNSFLAIVSMVVGHLPTVRALLSATIAAGQQYQATQLPTAVPQVPLEGLFQSVLAFFLLFNPGVFWQKFQGVIYVWKFVGTYLSIVFLIGVIYIEKKMSSFHREREAKRAAADPDAYAHIAAVAALESGLPGSENHFTGQSLPSRTDQAASQAAKDLAIRTKKWQRIVDHVESENPNDWRLAILEADILLDELLNMMHASGDTLGEKLKSMTTAEMPSLQLAWEGHRVRNQIAHEGANFVLSQREARRIMTLYERVLRQGLYI